MGQFLHSEWVELAALGKWTNRTVSDSRELILLNRTEGFHLQYFRPPME